MWADTNLTQYSLQDLNSLLRVNRDLILALSLTGFVKAAIQTNLHSSLAGKDHHDLTFQVCCG